MCTHTHRDHSPAARPLARAHRRADHRLRAAGAGNGRAARRRGVRRRLCAGSRARRRRSDRGRRPSRSPRSPRPATRPTICASPMADALFTGDHVMGWSTTVVVPPDGDMAAYMASLDKLRQRDDRIYYPGARAGGDQPAAICAPPDRPPDAAREADPEAGRRAAARRSPTSSPTPIPGSTRGWSTAAGGSVLAHLLDLERRGLVEREGDAWTAA